MSKRLLSVSTRKSKRPRVSAPLIHDVWEEILSYVSTYDLITKIRLLSKWFYKNTDKWLTLDLAKRLLPQKTNWGTKFPYGTFLAVERMKAINAMHRKRTDTIKNEALQVASIAIANPGPHNFMKPACKYEERISNVLAYAGYLIAFSLPRIRVVHVSEHEGYASGYAKRTAGLIIDRILGEDTPITGEINGRNSFLLDNGSLLVFVTCEEWKEMILAYNKDTDFIIFDVSVSDQFPLHTYSLEHGLSFSEQRSIGAFYYEETRAHCPNIKSFCTSVHGSNNLLYTRQSLISYSIYHYYSKRPMDISFFKTYDAYGQLIEIDRRLSTPWVHQQLIKVKQCDPNTRYSMFDYGHGRMLIETLFGLEDGVILSLKEL